MQERLETVEETIRRLERERRAADASRERALELVARRDVELAHAAGAFINVSPQNVLVIDRLWAYFRRRVKPGSRKQITQARANMAQRALAKGFTEQLLMRAIDGAKWGAWTNPETGRRFDGWETIFNVDAGRTDKMIARWEDGVRARRLSSLLNHYCLPLWAKEPEYDRLERCWRWMCPACRVGWRDGATILQGYRGGEFFCAGLGGALQDVGHVTDATSLGCEKSPTVPTLRAVLLEEFPLVETTRAPAGRNPSGARESLSASRTTSSIVPDADADAGT